MKKLLYASVALIVAAAVGNAQAVLPPGFAQAPLADSLNPTCMALSPDGRIFLAQKDGRVLLYHTDEGLLHDEPFVALNTDFFNERGLNGIALHPDFENQPWVYLYYTLPNEQRNRVSRVLANGDFAVPGSEQILLDLDLLSGSIHNAGALVFGNDGKLYVGVGDGAKSDNGQNLNTVLGKILRLSDDGSIPADNPFYSQLTGKNRAIYAYGVRNPFSMTCDPVSGRIFFCDVGAEAWEEVNELLPGANYGWKLFQGTSGDPSFADPLYAYDHDEGCAIVGAAFAFHNNSLIPSGFKGKFYFADYCEGWIKMLDPAIGAQPGAFVTGLDRPVSLLATPGGELYYLARAGLGGGSQEDNTASYEGVLWKVFWVGEGAPLMTNHPQSVLVAEGESAVFEARAFGGQPIQYQWYLDGAAIPGADSTVFILQNLSLVDSGSLVFCIAQNNFGSDTSQTATVGVSSNKRPVPEILLPLTNSFYRGGSTIYFHGQANDPEEGALPPDRLTWRIDFHHANHTHPALPATPGISEGQFFVPTVGETATDVFFRIYLTARDAMGFEKTVWRDVFPEKIQISIAGPAGVKVNVDGQNRTLPAQFESVIGIVRTLQAPDFQQVGDNIFLFSHWSDGDTNSLITFATPETPVALEAIFDTAFLGNGTGLLGQYFFDPQGDFNEPPILTRLDTTVNFIWDDGSPDPSIPADYFTVRWRGLVQPVFSETYHFYVSSDDGCRLWVNDSLIIDKWVPQATTEHFGSIGLQGGEKYKIKLEYLEIGGGANVQMFWSSAHQKREIVPKRQLYPPLLTAPSTIQGHIGLDTDNDGAWEQGEATFAGASVRLYDATKDSLVGTTLSLSDGRYALTDLPPGSYYLKIALPPTSDVLLPVQNVDNQGVTPVFALQEDEIKTLDAAWSVTMIALGGSVWLDQNGNDLKEAGEPFLPDIAVLLYRADSSLMAATTTGADGGYGFALVSPGSYFMLFLNQFSPVPVIPGFGLDAQGKTADFVMAQGQYRILDVAFVPEIASSVEDTAPTYQRPEMKLWPNPVGAMLWIETKNIATKPEVAQLSVFDETGRQVDAFLKISQFGEKWQLNLEHLPQGVYFLVIEGENKRAIRKFLKM